MGSLPVFVAIAGYTVLGGLFVAVALSMVTGQIDLGSLFSKKGDDATFSPERAQLFALTLAAAFYELHAIVHSRPQGPMPDLPAAWVAALGGSQVFYLFGKYRE